MTTLFLFDLSTFNPENPLATLNLHTSILGGGSPLDLPSNLLDLFSNGGGNPLVDELSLHGGGGNPFAGISSAFHGGGCNPAAYIPGFHGGGGGSPLDLLSADLSSSLMMFSGSDERFKKQIRRIDNPLTKIAHLEGYTYQMRTKEFPERNFTEGQKLGLIAQNVEKVFPELVTTFKDGYKAVNYNGLIPVLIEGVNQQQRMLAEQQGENMSLKEAIKKQNQQIATQQTQIAELKKLVEERLAQNVDIQKKTNPSHVNNLTSMEGAKRYWMELNT